MHEYEFYWSEDSEYWGIHDYCETYFFETYDQALNHAIALRNDPEIFNVQFYEIER